MANIYTSFVQLTIDSRLNAYLLQGGQLTLFLFPSIARNRWGWMVENFNTLSESFISLARGDERAKILLDDLTRQVDGYKLGNTKINPLENLPNIVKYELFLDVIPLTTLSLTTDEVRVRDEELKRISELTEDDFRNMLDFMRKETIIFTQEIGLGDTTVSALYGVNNRKKKRSANVTDLLRIDDVNQAYKAIEALIYDKRKTQKKPPNLLAIAQGNTASDSTFVPRDIYKTYVPVPFQISLENMARTYLGSPKSWYELVTINNLQPPFIDEVGTKFELLSPASSNSIVIPSDLYEYLTPGIRISIGSHKIIEESRVIERIILNENSTMVIFLSGLPDLNKLLTKHKAFVRIYKPHTVRKNSIILIPSTEGTSAESSKPTPSKDELKRLDKAFLEFGVDIAKDSNTNDWIIDSNGNFKLSYGFSAIRQAVRNALRTEKGELTYHPGFGVNINLGSSYLGSVDEAVLIGDLLVSSIEKDQRFERVDIAKIASAKNGAMLQLNVKIKGFDSVIPLSFVT
jgi:hypothetical protein